MKYYTGVGSRETPADVTDLMFDIACKLAKKDYVLRSGGADGADIAFEKGCDFCNGQKEIYLPWRGFNGNKSQLYNISKEAYNIAQNIHPTWNFLSHGSQKLHARNILQCSGNDLKSFSEFIICWTKNGLPFGGTRTAIIFGQKNNIPVYNLAIPETYDKLMGTLCKEK